MEKLEIESTHDDDEDDCDDDDDDDYDACDGTLSPEC